MGGEQLIFIAVDTLLAAILWMGVHVAIRRFPRNWWLGGAGLTIGVMMVTITLAPVYLDPLFNDYTPLPDGPVKTEVLKLARANGVPADNVYLVDASRQSDRISANVKGLFGTAPEPGSKPSLPGAQPQQGQPGQGQGDGQNGQLQASGLSQGL